jgi:hypothetical protein
MKNAFLMNDREPRQDSACNRQRHIHVEAPVITS